jgi:hypothetical protein
MPPPPFWRKSPQWARASTLTRFLDHTQRRTTVGRTRLDQGSARRRDLYLTAHNSQQTNIHAPGGIRAHDLSRRAAAILRLRPCGHSDRQKLIYLLTLLIYLLLTYLLPMSIILLENLTGFQLVEKFPAFYGTERLITAFTTARHLSLSWASSIQSIFHIPLPEDPS